LTTQLFSVTFDANDVGALARFWAEGLGWHIVVADPCETVVAPSQGPGVLLVFVPVPEPKSGKNRIHLDLAGVSNEDRSRIVNRLLRLGANYVGTGHGDVPWVVLADPEGNEFCVRSLNPRATETGSVAAIVLDAVDPKRLGRFWSEATGWPVVLETDRAVALRRRSGSGPFLTLGPPTAQKVRKNRIHFDLAAHPEDDQRAEVQRLVDLGAKPIDIGQGDVGWVVLADPEGNEFCVLSPQYVGDVGRLVSEAVFAFD
jgi:predicted enzyme related to lactoylglutathione lyase